MDYVRMKQMEVEPGRALSRVTSALKDGGFGRMADSRCNRMATRPANGRWRKTRRARKEDPISRVEQRLYALLLDAMENVSEKDVG